MTIPCVFHTLQFLILVIMKLGDLFTNTSDIATIMQAASQWSQELTYSLLESTVNLDLVKNPSKLLLFNVMLLFL